MKRDVLQPLELHMEMESIAKTQETYLVYNNTLCELDEAIIKLSIDDLYTFKSISEKLMNDIQTLGKIWSDKKAPKAISRDYVISELKFNAHSA